MEIKRCPFCGSDCEIMYLHDNWILYSSNILHLYKPGIVRCKKCKIQTATYSTVKRAINVWNKRIDND